MATETAVVRWLTENAVTLGVGLVGGVLAFIFYKKGQRLKKPSWAIRTNSLIKGFRSTLEGLSINFKGKPVGSVAVSRVVFWNDGSDTIDHSDIVNADPLRLVPRRGSVLLDAGIIASNNQSNRFAISPADDGSIRIEFDYVDKGQGIVLQVVHSGTSSNDIAIVGTIKGATIERRDPALSQKPPPPQPWMYSTVRGTIRFLVSLLIFAIVLSAFLDLLQYASAKYQIPYQRYFALAAITGVVLMFIRYIFRLDRPPKGLEAFLQDAPFPNGGRS